MTRRAALAPRASVHAQTGLGSLVVLVGHDPQSLVAELPVVPLDELLDSTTASVTVEGFGFDPRTR